jgi:membrane protein implicated in regulation of membrane protease activity/DNA-binding ferritin-like protein (Dps family)
MEAVVTDRSRIVDSIERYWLETGVPKSSVVEMRAELEQHLALATADGRRVRDVVGDDPATFAESWAAAYRHRRHSTATWSEVQTGEAALTRKTRRDLVFYGVGMGAVVAAVAVAGQGGSEVDIEVWRWLWTVFAIVMGIGEIFTAGFFLLPFAIGAGAAAILAWAGAAVLAQWLVFFGVSVFSLAYLRRFISRQDESEQPRVGANRWIGLDGIVIEEINPVSGTGMVKVESEEWRAIAPQQVPAGQKVVVTEVRGARLVVEPLETQS